MAEFSKQWVEKNVSEMGWDFDIDKVVSELPKSTMVPYICEGFGFIAGGDELCVQRVHGGLCGV